MARQNDTNNSEILNKNKINEHKCPSMFHYSENKENATRN